MVVFGYFLKLQQYFFPCALRLINIGRSNQNWFQLNPHTHTHTFLGSGQNQLQLFYVWLADKDFYAIISKL
jgi:hypothetical protein